MQTITEKYNITPSAGLLVYPNDKEDDDALHDPTTGDKDRDCDVFTRRGMINVGGLAFIVIGLLFLFIGYPILYVPHTSTQSHKDCSSFSNLGHLYGTKPKQAAAIVLAICA
jgi:hypothetical protein